MSISVDQRFALLAKLGENIDWDSLTTEQVQVGIREAKQAGAEATAFIRNDFRMQIGDFFREMEELALQIPALARPTLEELQGKFSWVKSIDRDTSPTDAVILNLATILRASEELVDGNEYECRIAPKPGLILGYQQAAWLVEHQDEFPGLMALLGKVYIHFSGLVVVASDGGRHFPHFRKLGVRWDLYWGWITDGFRQNGRVAVSGPALRSGQASSTLGHSCP